jgi:hypothetical protein
MGRAWWSKISSKDIAGRAGGRYIGGGTTAKAVIVTRDLQLIEKDTILTACKARGVGLEVPGKFDKKGNPVKVPLRDLAEKVGIEGEYFRSKKEASRFVQLKQAETSGIVKNLSRNPRWRLHAVNPRGLKVAISEYTADFAYDEEITAAMRAHALFGQEVGWHHVIEECKGFPTPDWELRRKWVEAEYGITIRVT